MQDLRLLSRPVGVRWAGWTSDTCTLQREGWQIETHYDICRDQHQLAMYHPAWDLRALSTKLSLYRHLQDPGYMHGDMEEIHFGMRAMSEKILLHQSYPNLPAFRPIDCEPQLVSSRVAALDDLCHFAPRDVSPAQTLILPQDEADDVNTLLRKLLERQDPERHKYYAEKAAQERTRLRKVHAQIISLGDIRNAA